MSAPRTNPGPAAKAAETKPPASLTASIREWTDALVIAFLLAMFIRLFVAEFFKIPSPSMTPTLLGTEPPRQAVSYYDVNGDGSDDLILRSGAECDVYEREDGTYRFAGTFYPDSAQRQLWMHRQKNRQDRIVVSKFLYWFSPPQRGDIVVFKVPEAIFEPSKPIYIKRVAGLPGETLTFEPTPGKPGHEETMGRLVADGRRVEQPSFFARHLYEYRDLQRASLVHAPSYARYRLHGVRADLVEAQVPEDGVYTFGDNTISSLDSRYWGAVARDRLRGRAIFRCNLHYFPYIQFPGFLK
ncbi:signal peptidase I [Candidatus Sumerlaeota bacterium]|nr:signal peptidase I [Candidatus Sumerlaeota bacterium]